MSKETSEIAKHFPLQSKVDLDFVINQDGWAVGMLRHSPPELKRRIASAVISYQLGLASVDYARRKFVAPQLFDAGDEFTGDHISDFLKNSLKKIRDQIWQIQTHDNKTYGQISAEFTLFRVNDTITSALLLTNRGLLLEVIPICRLALEMIAWSYCANLISDEQEVRGLKAESCFNLFKAEFRAAGKLYGLLSKFSHWRFDIHDFFINVEGKTISSVSASVKYRALSQCICLSILILYAGMTERLKDKLSGPTDKRPIVDTEIVSTSSIKDFITDIYRLTQIDEIMDV